MELTIPLLQKTFDYLNKTFFNNELPKITLKISRRRDNLGSFRFRIDNTTNKKTPVYISISNYYDVDEKFFMATLCHEMIHYYVCHFNLPTTSGCHTGSFLKKMNEINSIQDKFKVTIYGNISGLETRKTKKGIEDHVIVFDYKGHKRIAKVSKRLSFEELKRKFHFIPPFKLYSICNSDINKMIQSNKTVHFYKLSEIINLSTNDLKLIAA